MDKAMENWLKKLEEEDLQHKGIQKVSTVELEIYEKMDRIKLENYLYRYENSMAEMKGEEEVLKVEINYTRILKEIHYEIMVLEDQRMELIKKYNVKFNGVNYFKSDRTEYERVVKELEELEAEYKEKYTTKN